MAEHTFGEWLANELVATLEGMLAETELRAYRGQKIVEVKLGWANKGEVLSRLAGCDDADVGPALCLAAGDDRTDEDLFASLPEGAWTIHVGTSRTRARYSVPSPEELRRLLARLAEADELGATTAAAAGETNA
jgi:trehalose 6-phosphate synthase/phosphatase